MFLRNVGFSPNYSIFNPEDHTLQKVCSPDFSSREQTVPPHVVLATLRQPTYWKKKHMKYCPFPLILYCDTTHEKRNSEVRIDLHLLGNDSVNISPRKQIRKQQSRNFRCYATVL
jgi:hypothetical protein